MSIKAESDRNIRFMNSQYIEFSCTVSYMLGKKKRLYPSFITKPPSHTYQTLSLVHLATTARYVSLSFLVLVYKLVIGIPIRSAKFNLNQQSSSEYLMNAIAHGTLDSAWISMKEYSTRTYSREVILLFPRFPISVLPAIALVRTIW